jgi:hypothetical protein
MTNAQIHRQLVEMNARLREATEFSIVGTLAAGAALHVGQNAITKKLITSGKGQRILASVVSAGRKHAGQGRELHPAVQRVSDLLLGPEYSELYHAGQKTGAIGHLMQKARLKMGGDAASQSARIMAGPTSKHADWLMNKLPSVEQGKKKWTGRVAGALAGAGAAMVEPVLPAVNAVRTLAAHSKLGQKMTENAAKAGAQGQESKGLLRTIQDYTLSPAISHVQNTAYHAIKQFRPPVS